MDLPIGGERTLVVRIVVGEPAIVCESDVREPPEADCGTGCEESPVACVGVGLTVPKAGCRELAKAGRLADLPAD